MNDTDDPGRRRVAGMTIGAWHATVFLFLFSLFLAAANVLFTATVVHRSAATRASITQLCEAGNAARAQQIQLWEFLISISRPPPGQTPAEKRQREKTIQVFVAHIHKVFAQRDCGRLS